MVASKLSTLALADTITLQVTNFQTSFFLASNQLPIDRLSKAMSAPETAVKVPEQPTRGSGLAPIKQE
jgi:hypothetical protein